MAAFSDESEEQVTLLQDCDDILTEHVPESSSVHRLVYAGLAAGAIVAIGTMLNRGGSPKSTAEESEVFVSLASNNSNDDFAKCSWPLQNCTDTQCCSKPGQQCYMQNQETGYSSCMYDCAKGPHPSHWDGGSWECIELGERSKGTSKCSAGGEDCSNTLCCEQAGTQCFKKSDGWATCKTECLPGAPDMSDQDGHHWSCEKLGPWAQGAAPWVESQCAADGEKCAEKGCCAGHGKQCYEMNQDWSECKYDCTPGPGPDGGPEWTCNAIGDRTPSDPSPHSGVIGKWALDTCSWNAQDCTNSRCCRGFNQRCFEKNEDWAVCKESCVAGLDPYDKNETWSCKALGPVSQGLTIKGSPSLYCWSLFQTTTYEMEVMQNQMDRGVGIFQCDGWALLSTDEPKKLGTFEGKKAITKKVAKAEITVSVDGTAGNAELFINCWNVIVEDGAWNDHAWTVKADPDAVLIPDRLRTHLAPYVNEDVYVVNCNKVPGSPNFPMMFGSLEIYSWKAIQTYANGMSHCMDTMAQMLPLWGEDYFMTHCLDSIGVGRINDFAVIGDAVCTGANCGDSWVSAFHPFKSVDSWQQCWDEAHR